MKKQVKNIGGFILNTLSLFCALALSPLIVAFYIKVEIPHIESHELIVGIVGIGLIFFPLTALMNVIYFKQYFMKVLSFILLIYFLALAWSIFYTLIQE